MSDNEIENEVHLGINFVLNVEHLASLPQEEQELIVAGFMHETAVQIEAAIRMELIAYKARLN